MSTNSLETAVPARAESRRQLKPERVSDINGRIIRKLSKMLVDYPEVRGILDLGDVTNSSERVPTFDATPNGGLDMTREWGNTISSLDGVKVLRVQPPSVYEIFEESIHMFQGDSPQLDVRITIKGGQQIPYSNSTKAFTEAMRIVSRLGEQLMLKKKVLSASD